MFKVSETIMKYKREILILLVPFVISTSVGLISKPVFQSEIIMSPASDSSSSIFGSGSGLQNSIISSFINSDSSLIQRTLSTATFKSFLSSFVEKYNLYSVLGLSNKNDKWAIQEEMMSSFSIEKIDTSSLYMLKMQFNSAQLSSEMANNFVKELNSFMQQKELERISKNIQSLDERIALAEKSETRKMLYNILGSQVNLDVVISSDPEYVFRVIDRASTPIQPIWPNYLYLYILSLIFSTFFLGTFYFFKEKLSKDTSET